MTTAAPSSTPTPFNYANEFYDNALRTAIRAAIINQKANVCPFIIRLAWHASGTYDHVTSTGGSNGATMRFAPEINDPANAGLSIAQDILLSVQQQFPDVSIADIWTLAGCVAIECMGGPKVPFQYGRTDDTDHQRCPAHGRLPDAKLGASHLRDVFYRMGFDDRDIVALSGAHTVGSCHRLRSGFDGPWTSHPLQFNNEYFRNLFDKTWIVQPDSDPQQYMDVETNKLMMLPSDMCLIEDDKFKEYVTLYAQDESKFFHDFANAFGKLIRLGCPALNQTTTPQETGSKEVTPEMEFRDLAMHGSIEKMQKLIETHGNVIDINAGEMHSRRTALHKASYFGHAHVVQYLLSLPSSSTTTMIQVNVPDVYGDTPLHDAARFGHTSVVEALLSEGLIDPTMTNHAGQTPLDIATRNGKTAVVELLSTK
jgi:catalase (peroxidase I)